MPKQKIVLQEEMAHEPLYIQLYHYYKMLIIEGTLSAGTRLPSIRKCADERRVSRTTVETAYAQLAAEGYITANAGSGFYVGTLDYTQLEQKRIQGQEQNERRHEIQYDFSSARVDPKSFNFDIWRRYIKSALRNVERLLSYGDPQGEYDLRVALTTYIREKRGVVCTPEQIVIGAGMQSLIHILCSLMDKPGHIAFTGSSYKQGKAVFEDRGYKTWTYDRVDYRWDAFEENKIDFIYTSPSHVTEWGEVMTMKTRLALISYAKHHQTLIIEDDYDSEFSYYNRPTPSLQGIDGGQNVIYMSTFSKLLLPSLRLSFMVLPLHLVAKYKEKGTYYNQTASKAEQIALCQFIRDGHLEKQIRRAKKLYMHKKEQLCASIESIFQDKVSILSGGNCFIIQMEMKTPYNAKEIMRKAEAVGVRLKVIEEQESEAQELQEQGLEKNKIQEQELKKEEVQGQKLGKRVAEIQGQKLEKRVVEIQKQGLEKNEIKEVVVKQGRQERELPVQKKENPRVLLSCSGVPEEVFEIALKSIYDCIYS